MLLLAAALRFYRLDAPDLWGDEAFSIWLSQQPLERVVAGAADTHPPFYPLLLFFWLRVVGASAFATRALAALTGILAVPLIFVFARRITARARVAWFAALLAAVSPLLIYYSQEARMYELVAVLALASSYFAARVLERGRDAGAYFVSTALAVYTHYSAFFVLAAQNLFALARLRRDRAAGWRWVALQIALVLAYVPWILAQAGFLRGKASARWDEWTWRGVEMIFGKTFLAFGIGLTLDAPLAQVSAAAFLFFAALGAFAIWRAREHSAWLAPLCFGVPVVIAYLINPVMPFFFERYVLVALPGFLVTVAFGLDALATRSFRAAIVATMVLLLVNVLALDNYYHSEAYAKGKYGKMMAYVAARAQPGDALILNNPLQKPLYQYYAPRDVPAFFLPDGAPLEDPQTRQHLAEIADAHTRLWLVMFGNPAEYDPTGYLERWLGAHAFRAYSDGWVDARLSLYVMPRAQTAIGRDARATLGEYIQLIGYALDRAEISPGETLLLTLRWQTTAPLDKRYTVFTHLIGETNPATHSPVWAQMDSEPVGGSRPTTTWQPGETMDDHYGLLLPKAAPPGEYQIEIGMYDTATRVRLPVYAADGARVPEDRVLLGAVRVKAR